MQRPKQTLNQRNSEVIASYVSEKAVLATPGIIMDLPDTFLEGYDRSYFIWGHGEHLLLPHCHLEIHYYEHSALI